MELNRFELYKKIISIDSTPETGNEEVALFCADTCRKAGFDVVLQEGSLQGLKQLNVIARPKKSSKKNEVLFETHIDTVAPGPLGNWTKTDHNPFQATIDGDRIYGLGTADVKLDFLCKVFALKDFLDKPMQRPFVLVGTYAEEIGMHGAQKLMDEKACDVKMAIIGEPSELKITHANNGYLVVQFDIPFSQEEKKYLENHDAHTSTEEKIFHGKAAHSSTPHLGENAISKLIDYLAKLPSGIAILKAQGGSSVNTVPAEAHIEVDPNSVFKSSVGAKLVAVVKDLRNLEREFLNYETKLIVPSHPTLNLGLLKTSDEGLGLKVSLRITPEILKTQVDLWLKRMNDHAEKNGCSFVAERFSPPALTSLESPLVKGALEISKSLDMPTTPFAKAGGTEMSVYGKYGIDSIVIGPGISIGNSHTPNEYNFLTHLEKATRFYGEAVKRFCL